MTEQLSSVASDLISQFASVLGSSVSDATGAIQFSLEGVGALTEESDDPADGEGDDETEVFGALGIVTRPLPPTSKDGKAENAEVMCLRTADGLVPHSGRDVRLRMGGAAPTEGTVAQVGYGGAFHSMSAVDGENAELGSIQIIYCPYDPDVNGVPQKAHVITLDPTAGNESISIVHGNDGINGQALLLQNDGSITMQSPDGQTFVKVEDTKLTMQSDQIVLLGNVFIGDPILALPFPLLIGATSPPCPRLFLSPTL